MSKHTSQLKSPKAYGNMSKRYGPGFVALSVKSGRVIAYGKTMEELWVKVKVKKIYKDNQAVIRHVPSPHATLTY